MSKRCFWRCRRKATLPDDVLGSSGTVGSQPGRDDQHPSNLRICTLPPLTSVQDASPGPGWRCCPVQGRCPNGFYALKLSLSALLRDKADCCERKQKRVCAMDWRVVEFKTIAQGLSIPALLCVKRWAGWAIQSSGVLWGEGGSERRVICYEW